LNLPLDLLRIAVLVAAGLLTAGALRHASAQARHDLWTLIVLGVLVVPVWDLFLPNFYVNVSQRWEPLAVPTARGVPLLTAIWLVGIVVAAARFAGGWRGLRRIATTGHALRGERIQAALASAARLAGVRRPVQLLASPAISVPATWGVRRPVIALPEAATNWSEERLRLVLLHELLHVRRRDVVVEYALWLASAVYWFHPAVWLAARRLRLERERACDEAVVATGARASDYCEHLLQIMRAARQTHGGAIVGAAMATPSTIEHRVQTLLARPGGRTRAIRELPLVVVGALVVCAVTVVAPCIHVAAQVAAPHATVARR
jgi:beta-lactamase regulating signal transducer with metallopeptidase domain